MDTNHGSSISDLTIIKKGIDEVLGVRKNIPAQYKNFTDPAYKKAFDALSKAKGTEIENYINNALK